MGPGCVPRLPKCSCSFTGTVGAVPCRVLDFCVYPAVVSCTDWRFPLLREIELGHGCVAFLLKVPGILPPSPEDSQRTLMLMSSRYWCALELLVTRVTRLMLALGVFLSGFDGASLSSSRAALSLFSWKSHVVRKCATA